jgi:hypothetical protein
MSRSLWDQTEVIFGAAHFLFGRPQAVVGQLLSDHEPSTAFGHATIALHRPRASYLSSRSVLFRPVGTGRPEPGPAS